MVSSYIKLTHKNCQYSSYNEVVLGGGGGADRRGGDGGSGGTYGSSSSSWYNRTFEDRRKSKD